VRKQLEAQIVEWDSVECFDHREGSVIVMPVTCYDEQTENLILNNLKLTHENRKKQVGFVSVKIGICYSK